MNDRAERFEWKPGDLQILGKCHLCRHDFRGKSGCKAFPDEIPLEINTGDFDHSNPYPGDNGTRFEPRDKG